MYYQEDRDQLSMEEFSLPFGGRLRKDNRWVRTAQIMPQKYIEEIYAKNLVMSQKIGIPKKSQENP